MLKFNLAGSVQEELEKIALDKGWVKMAEGPVDTSVSSPSGYSADAQKAKIQSLDVSGLQTMLNKFMQEYSKKSGLNYPFKLDVNGTWDGETAEVWNMVSKILGNKLQQSGPENAPSSGQINGAIGLMINTLKGEGVDLAGGAKAVPSVGKATEQTKEWASNVPAPHSMTDATKGLYQSAPKTVMPKALSREERIRDFMNTHPSFTQEEAESEINRIDYNKRQGSVKSNLSKRAEDNFPGNENQGPVPFTPGTSVTKEVKYEWKTDPTNPQFKINDKLGLIYYVPGKQYGKIDSEGKWIPVANPYAQKKPIKPQYAKGLDVGLVKQVQVMLDVYPDGKFGPKTLEKWNNSGYVKSFPAMKITSLVNINSNALKEFVKFYPNEQPADDSGKKNEEAMMLAAKGMPAHKALENVASKTINELISLANELEEIGEQKAAIAVDNQINFYKQAMDKLYDVTGETGEKFIGDSHKDHVTIAPAKEEGGKIENIVEQQEKDLEAATKDPTGKYAKTIMELIATASQLEEAGEIEAAERVDRAIYELQGKLPFANKKLGEKATNFYMKKNALDQEIAKEDKDFLEKWWRKSKYIYETITDDAISFCRNSMGKFDKDVSPVYTTARNKLKEALYELYRFFNNLKSKKSESNGYMPFKTMQMVIEVFDKFAKTVEELNQDGTLGELIGWSDKADFILFTNGAVRVDDKKRISEFLDENAEMIDKVNKMPENEKSTYLFGKSINKAPSAIVPVGLNKEDPSASTKKVIEDKSSKTFGQVKSADPKTLTNEDKLYLEELKSYQYNIDQLAKTLSSAGDKIISELQAKGIKNWQANKIAQMADSFANTAKSIDGWPLSEKSYNWAQGNKKVIYNAWKALEKKYGSPKEEQKTTANKYELFLKRADDKSDPFADLSKLIGALGVPVDKNAPAAASGKPKGTGGTGGTQRGIPFNRNLHKQTVLEVQNNINRVFTKKEGETAFLKADKMYGPITHTGLIYLLKDKGLPVSYSEMTQEQLDKALETIKTMKADSVPPPVKPGEALVAPVAPGAPGTPAQIATQPGQVPPATPIVPVAPGQGEITSEEQADFDATLQTIEDTHAELLNLLNAKKLGTPDIFIQHFSGLNSRPSEQLARLIYNENFAETKLLDNKIKGRIIGQKGQAWYNAILKDFNDISIYLSILHRRIPTGDVSRPILQGDEAAKAKANNQNAQVGNIQEKKNTVEPTGKLIPGQTLSRSATNIEQIKRELDEVQKIFDIFQRANTKDDVPDPDTKLINAKQKLDMIKRVINDSPNEDWAVVKPQYDALYSGYYGIFMKAKSLGMINVDKKGQIL